MIGAIVKSNLVQNLIVLEQEQYDSYTLAAKRAVEAETALETAGEAATAEALAILSGEVSA